jgi:hypothetical protein
MKICCAERGGGRIVDPATATCKLMDAAASESSGGESAVFYRWRKPAEEGKRRSEGTKGRKEQLLINTNLSLTFD